MQQPAAIPKEPALPNEPTITPELVAEHGLTPEEYARILELIGREPTLTELGIFSAMWNEHCSYKSSKVHLKTLPTEAPWVIQGPGENAGVIAIGDGLALVFKMESHNHPSYIEPYQGAATGDGALLGVVVRKGAGLNSPHTRRPDADLGSKEHTTQEQAQIGIVYDLVHVQPAHVEHH